VLRSYLALGDGLKGQSVAEQFSETARLRAIELRVRWTVPVPTLNRAAILWMPASPFLKALRM
jgi:hypothetical protein